MYCWTRESIVCIGCLFAPSSLWQVEALTGAVIDRPRSTRLLSYCLPWPLTSNKRCGWLCVCVCVCDGRAGEGRVQISSNAIKFGAVHPWLTQYLSELIAQVHRANIGLQVSDTIADRLREGTNKYCLVKWQTVTPPPSRGEGKGWFVPARNVSHVCMWRNGPVVHGARIEHLPCLRVGWEGKVCVCWVGTKHSQTRYLRYQDSRCHTV